MLTKAPSKEAPAPAGAATVAPSAAQSAALQKLADEVPLPETSCYPRSSLTAQDLLPADLDATNSKWASMNPTTGGAIEDQNLLTAGWTVGVNTVQNSLRNPNLQLRSEPPNPVKPVSPWMISTIGPDTNRRDMEIGSQPYLEN